MAVEVKITVDENTSLESVIVALTTLAGGSFSLPQKLSKNEDMNKHEDAEKENKASTTKPDKKPEGTADENTGDDTGEGVNTSDDDTEDKPTYKLADVRKKLVALSQAGKNKEVTKLLAKYGSKNITGLDPANYAAVMAEADEL